VKEVPQDDGGNPRFERYICLPTNLRFGYMGAVLAVLYEGAPPAAIGVDLCRTQDDSGTDDQGHTEPGTTPIHYLHFGPTFRSSPTNEALFLGSLRFAREG